MMITISQLVAHIKVLLADDPMLSDIWVEGEVSNFKQATSGHCYFTLKDSAAVLPCVMWRADAQRLRRLPQDGEQVAVHGYVAVYEAQGKMQFYADHLELAGVGRLYRDLEALKARLTAEGLFDSSRKRSLPAWPRRIGIVTSAQAAALRDILRTLAVRYPLVDVVLAPAAVQGVDAPPQIVSALELLTMWSTTREPIDLIILARGGGSIEELWAFNDERVVRAIAASSLPVLSGVGHETDVTLADFAADLRAPTPTGAAALAVPDSAELANQVRILRRRLPIAWAKHLAVERRRLAQSRRLLVRLSPQAQIGSRRQQVDDSGQALARQIRQQVLMRRVAVAGLRARLMSLDPHAVLQRGYAIVQQESTGRVVASVRDVSAGDHLHVLVADGEFETFVQRTEKEVA
jgi:exodeoxyribonuclease VII large subunit